MKTIVAILGTSGAKVVKCLPGEAHKPALYDLSLFQKKSNSYKNSTEFLLDQFEGEFIFIGTACAIMFQKALLKEALRDKSVRFVEISDNDLDEIFEHIFTILENNDEILLDVTHGFRHQPIMAIFASTLSQFLHRKSLHIIFAKEEEQFKKYRYIYLNEYIEITQISLLLTGFIRTFNFIPLKNITLFNTKIFEGFTKSLLSNDLKGVETNYLLLQSELTRLLQNQELQHLFTLLTEIKNILSPLDALKQNHTETYRKYLILSQITLDKNYIVVALSYLFESVRGYCVDGFKPILKGVKIKKGYNLDTAVMDTISNFERNGKPNKIQTKYANIYNNNKNNFSRISAIYKEIRTLRNDLAHINYEKDFKDIKQMIHGISFKVETLFKDDVLQKINI